MNNKQKQKLKNLIKKNSNWEDLYPEELDEEEIQIRVREIRKKKKGKAFRTIECSLTMNLLK